MNSFTVPTSCTSATAPIPTCYRHSSRIRAPGTYRWQACWGYNSRIRHYQARSTLRGHGFSHTILNTFKRDPNQITGRSHLYGNGYYEWGGRIARYTPGVTEPSG